MNRAPGRVTLVGAGPGDPDLLTLAAVRAIASADVILVDDLVDPRVLAHASASARVVPVGKRGPICRSARSTPQAFIERLMRTEAARGRHVVRLKGGDPYTFGRGGEERMHLVEAGIDVQVVPGVSSGVAAPGAIGIPVTHRDHSQGVVFVTGHRKVDAPEVDWAPLAATGLTLVVYMGVARCRAITDALLAGGMRADMPAAAIQSACTDRQRQAISTVTGLADAIERAAIGSPAILVFGEVVQCADRRWLALAA